jgi:hypothetical protein
VSAAEVLRRRDACGGQLFAGRTFVLTPGAAKLPVLRATIAAHGGKVSAPQTLGPRVLDGGDAAHKHVVSVEEDAKLWQPLVRAGHPVFSKEFVLGSACTQKIDVDDTSQRVPGSF